MSTDSYYCYLVPQCPLPRFQRPRFEHVALQDWKMQDENLRSTWITLPLRVQQVQGISAIFHRPHDPRDVTRLVSVLVTTPSHLRNVDLRDGQTDRQTAQKRHCLSHSACRLVDNIATTTTTAPTHCVTSQLIAVCKWREWNLTAGGLSIDYSWFSPTERINWSQTHVIRRVYARHKSRVAVRRSIVSNPFTRGSKHEASLEYTSCTCILNTFASCLLPVCLLV